MTLLMFIILLLIIMIVVIGVGFTLLFGIFGYVFSGVLTAFLFILKYAFPVIIISGIAALIFRKKNWKAAFVATGVILFIAEIIFAFSFLGKTGVPDLVPLEEISQVSFSSGLYFDEYVDGHWTYGEESTTDDMTYVQALYNEVSENEYTNTLKEFIDFDEFENCCKAELFDENGTRLSSVIFYGSQYLSVETGGVTSYFKTEGSLNDDVMDQLFYDQRAETIHETWDSFAASLSASIEFKDDGIVFTIPEIIPEDVPGTSHGIHTDIKGSYINEDGKIETYDMEWEVEKKQDWVPGGAYRIGIDYEKTYARFKITFTVASEDWEFNALDLLPEELILR